MKITAPRTVLVAAVASVVVLAGCSDSNTSAETPTAAAEPPTTASTDSPSSAEPSAEPSAESSAEPTVDPSPVPKPTKAPSTPSAATGPSPALVSVRNDVESIAPQLESYYRDREYPEDLAQVRQTLDGSGVTLRTGNTVAGYVYDGDAVEFTLCIENTSGAWATYDTAPMSLRQSNETGGCR